MAREWVIWVLVKATFGKKNNFISCKKMLLFFCLTTSLTAWEQQDQKLFLDFSARCHLHLPEKEGANFSTLVLRYFALINNL